ncbi:photosystem reaction center subunit H [Desulfosporosinus fructosivorans]|uniref:Photosystem reaction center subunit H n=1 Tax=Desulfosporosinus fructosivorans TaxID=2018669 RepID=A0A4Z0R3L9_9FIRM|nr:PRC-barrel domain-containing protein [Desulfosporosinus fructosivorans]TGE36743.1 photosystem reaction center subunit H [Desulfosporosinus fructosivorans]
MTPTKEIIGLRIISILDGNQVGVVKDFVLNPKEKTLDFLIVDQPTDIFGAKVIAFADILGLGEFAIMIPHPGVIQDVTQNIDAQNLLKLDTHVLGTKVLTKKGQLIGVVTEILIDEETGRIATCLFESQGEMHQVEIEQIITLGKELLIVEGSPAVPNQQIMKPKIENEIPMPEESTLLEETDAADEVIEEVNVIEEVQPTEGTVSIVEKETEFNLFEQRQLQYFIGKKVNKDIVLDNAEILLAGELITPEIVTYITKRTTLMEVTSHLQKN